MLAATRLRAWTRSSMARASRSARCAPTCAVRSGSLAKVSPRPRGSPASASCAAATRQSRSPRMGPRGPAGDGRDVPHGVPPATVAGPPRAAAARRRGPGARRRRRPHAHRRGRRARHARAQSQGPEGPAVRRDHRRERRPDEGAAQGGGGAGGRARRAAHDRARDVDAEHRPRRRRGAGGRARVRTTLKRELVPFYAQHLVAEGTALPGTSRPGRTDKVRVDWPAAAMATPGNGVAPAVQRVAEDAMPAASSTRRRPRTTGRRPASRPTATSAARRDHVRPVGRGLGRPRARQGQARGRGCLRRAAWRRDRRLARRGGGLDQRDDE